MITLNRRGIKVTLDRDGIVRGITRPEVEACSGCWEMVPVERLDSSGLCLSCLVDYDREYQAYLEDMRDNFEAHGTVRIHRDFEAR